METVEQALQFVDSILAKVACSREDHNRIRRAIDMITEAVYAVDKSEE